MKKIFEVVEKVWNIFIKSGLEIATPIISAGVAAKTKNPQSAQTTNKILKSLTRGKFFITNRDAQHGSSFEGNVNHFKQSFYNNYEYLYSRLI